MVCLIFNDRHAVLVRGINLLDTAPWYGHGTSEKTIGYALDNILQEDDDEKTVSFILNIECRKRTGDLPRDCLIINTKVGRYESQPIHQFDFSYKTTMKSVERSIQRMNCTYIDVIQLHDPEFAPNISILKEETIPALLKCRRRGWAKAIGLTGYPLEVQHQILIECQEQLTSDAVVFDQSLVYCHNNLHDMSLYRDRCFPSVDIELNGSNDDNISFAQFCQKSNIQLMAAAPLSMGLLTSAGPPDWHPASITLKMACCRATQICETKGVNASSLALLFALSQPGVGCTLLGMKNIEEVDVAADLAMRFWDVHFDTHITGHRQDCEYKKILNNILTKTEREVLDLILDEDNGPFAAVISSGEYRWNWKDEVTRFWSSVQESEHKK